MLRDLKTLWTCHTLFFTYPTGPTAALGTWWKLSKSLYWMFLLLLMIQCDIMKLKWAGHGPPFHIQLFPTEWTTLPLRQKQRTHSKAELKAVAVIVVYISLDRGVIMLASKAFSSTFHLGMLVQEEASFYSYILQMETQRRELFAQGHRVKPTFSDIC